MSASWRGAHPATSGLVIEVRDEEVLEAGGAEAEDGVGEGGEGGVGVGEELDGERVVGGRGRGRPSSAWRPARPPRGRVRRLRAARGECLVVRSGSRGGCYRNGAGRVNPSAARKRISHTFPQFREIPLRAAHPHRAGGIGTAAASRGRSNSTVRETHTIVRSGSGDFNQNHVRWNRLRDLRAPGNDSHRVRLRLRRREQVFQRVGGGVQMETFAVP